MRKNIPIAVVPAAGRGTRMAPASRFTPKELLPVGPCPMIQWCLEEIVQAGIPGIAVIGSASKPQIRDFVKVWKAGRRIRLTFIDQPRPQGLADALFRARRAVGAGSFALVLPDNVFFASRGSPGATAQVLRAYEYTDRSTCGLIRVRPAEAGRFSHAGLVDIRGGHRWPTRIRRLRGKRKGMLSLPGGSPSYRTFARAVLTRGFFECLDRHTKRAPDADEVPALQALADSGELYGVLLKGRGFDAGNPAGYAAAVRSWARRRTHPTK